MKPKLVNLALYNLGAYTSLSSFLSHRISFVPAPLKCYLMFSAYTFLRVSEPFYLYLTGQYLPIHSANPSSDVMLIYSFN